MNTQDIFDKAMAFVAEAEGGYSNDEGDPGGETNYGVSQAFLKSLDIKKAPEEITPEFAKSIFRQEFWDRFGLDEFALTFPATCTGFFDAAVNMGAGRPAYYLQVALEEKKLFRGDKAMNLGLATKAAWRKAKPEDDIFLFTRGIDQRIIFYKKLGIKKPQFVRGWLNRCNNLKAMVMKTYGE
jgi:lysozyme family protein